MRILILGSHGFIGSHLVNYFSEEGHIISGCDLAENQTSHYDYKKISILSSDFDSLLLNQAFDICINASGSGNVSFSIMYPLSDFEANTFIVGKVLDTIRKYQPHCKYIHISSAAVYGNPRQLPIKESSEIAPLSPYGYHKWMSEIICREYYQLFNLPVVIIRPFSVYGNGLKKQLLWDICSKLKNADAIDLYGTGQESRDFIHVQDLSRLLQYIIQSEKFSCDVFNAASGNETTIRQIADIFQDHYDGTKRISFSGHERPGDPINWRADIHESTAIGYSPSIGLKEGVLGFIEWFESLENAGTE